MSLPPPAPRVPGILAGRRPTWLEIDLDALAANFRVLTEAAGGRPLWCVVKADAYGHGALDCSLTLESAGAAGLVVALPEEGIALRRGGIGLPILLSGPLPAGGAVPLLDHDIMPALSRVEDLRRLEDAAALSGHSASFHLEIDSGMTRMGLPPGHLEAFMEVAAGCSHCHLQAVFSHLASVHEPGDEAAQRQLERFSNAVRRVRELAQRDIPCHLASSPALCGFPQAACDMARPGLLLYGVSPAPTLQPPASLAPVLSLRATLVLLQEVTAGVPVGYEGTWASPTDTRLGVISAGYADGLWRDCAGRAEAILNGERVPYVGAVNMDLAQVDLGTRLSAHPGDVVTIIGRHGDAAISLEELAGRTGRTAYEWLTTLGGRVPRLTYKAGRLDHVWTPTGSLRMEC
ncbi:MAG: alanine racemase [Acidobacteria bacterium]|nr:alanine racemase [Acidobacteriota bacterium]MCZ6833375.1 alanine racemase [Acidobacteriota bacterium]